MKFFLFLLKILYTFSQIKKWNRSWKLSVSRKPRKHPDFLAYLDSLAIDAKCDCAAKE